MMKCRIQMENFSGKSALSIYQDFHAKIFSKTLTSIIATTTKGSIKKLSEQRIYDYQINFTQALSRMKNAIVLLLCAQVKKGVASSLLIKVKNEDATPLFSPLA